MHHIDVIPLVSLIKQCMAISKAALDTQHPIQRELLLYLLYEKQKELALVIDIPTEFDNPLSTPIEY